jgi:hypothetical protein
MPVRDAMQTNSVTWKPQGTRINLWSPQEMRDLFIPPRQSISSHNGWIAFEMDHTPGMMLQGSSADMAGRPVLLEPMVI